MNMDVEKYVTLEGIEYYTKNGILKWSVVIGTDIYTKYACSFNITNIKKIRIEFVYYKLEKQKSYFSVYMHNTNRLSMRIVMYIEYKYISDLNSVLKLLQDNFGDK